MKTEIRKFLNIFAVIRQVYKRFPLAFIFIILSTLSALILTHNINITDNETILRFYLFCMFAAIANVSLKIYIESHNSSRTAYFAGSVIITLLAAAYAWVVYESGSGLLYFLFFVLLLLSWIFAAYINRNSSNNSVWFFNYQSGVAIFFAGLAAMIFAAGLSFVLFSVRYLFEIDINNKLYWDIWIIAAGLLFTLYVLANISTEYDFPDEECDFPRGIRFIANYVLMPLMYIYTTVLYAYFIKIGLQGELPRGNLGWMISVLGIIGISTYLVIYPIREKGNRLLFWFSEYFYDVLIIPVLMLFFVLYIRISDYGITENRYILLILAIWFVLLILNHIVQRAKGEPQKIKIIPMILFALLLITAYGPWSIIQLPFENQLSRFETLLKKNNMFENGLWRPASSEVPFADRASLSSIADYMTRNRWRFRQIKTKLKNIETLDNKKRLYGRDIMRALNLEYISRWDAKKNRHNERNFRFNNNGLLGNKLFKIEGYDYMGKANMYTSNKGYARKKLNFGKEKNIELIFKNNSLRIILPTDTSIEYDLEEFVKSLQENKSKTDARFFLTKTSGNKKYLVTLVFENINGKVKNKKQVIISYMRYYLLLKENN